MSESLEQRSTEPSGRINFSLGGLILVLAFCAPIFIVIGISKAISLLADGPENTINRGN